MIKVVDHSDEFLRDLIAATDAGLRAASHEGADGAAASMPGAGATKYTSPTGQVRYFGSNPGSPPGVRTNRLKGSVTNARIQPLVWGYGTNVKYGRHLEYGASTPGGQPFWKDESGNLHFAKKSSPHAARMAKTKPGRIAPHPWLRPTLTSERVNMERAFVRVASQRMAQSITARVA